MSYQHTQRGTLVLVALGTAALLMIILAMGQLAIGGTAFAVCALLMLLFGSLTVAVDSTSIALRFGIGWVRRQIPLQRVESAEVIRTRWYYGWGIRLTPKGWMWNTSGLDAVQLNYNDGKRFIIGTDDAAALAAEINQLKKQPRSQKALDHDKDLER